MHLTYDFLQIINYMTYYIDQIDICLFGQRDDDVIDMYMLHVMSEMWS